MLGILVQHTFVEHKPLISEECFGKHYLLNTSLAFANCEQTAAKDLETTLLISEKVFSFTSKLPFVVTASSFESSLNLVPYTRLNWTLSHSGPENFKKVQAKKNNS